ncbi:MAG: hypothetical protein ACYDC8_15135 [Gammaproteobacteria bacterium]
MSEKFSRWDAADYLKSEENIAAYFEACLEEYPGRSAAAAGARDRAGDEHR